MNHHFQVAKTRFEKIEVYIYQYNFASINDVIPDICDRKSKIYIGQAAEKSTVYTLNHYIS